MAKTTRLTVTITIVQNGEQVQAQVTGTHYPFMPSTDYYTPPDDASFDIDRVVVNGVDITAKLEAEDYDFADIEERCLNAIEE